MTEGVKMEAMSYKNKTQAQFQMSELFRNMLHMCSNLNQKKPHHTSSETWWWRHHTL